MSAERVLPDAARRACRDGLPAVGGARRGLDVLHGEAQAHQRLSTLRERVGHDPLERIEGVVELVALEERERLRLERAGDLVEARREPVVAGADLLHLRGLPGRGEGAEERARAARQVALPRETQPLGRDEPREELELDLGAERRLRIGIGRRNLPGRDDGGRLVERTRSGVEREHVGAVSSMPSVGSSARMAFIAVWWTVAGSTAMPRAAMRGSAAASTTRALSSSARNLSRSTRVFFATGCARGVAAAPHEATTRSASNRFIQNPSAFTMSRFGRCPSNSA